MKLPAYAKALLKRRSSGADPWLVICAAGALIDQDILEGAAGVQRIGVELSGWDEVKRIDFSAVLGLDVLVSTFAPEERVFPDKGQYRRFHDLVLEALWRAQPATLWLACAGGAAVVEPFNLAHPERGMVCLGKAFPLNAGFREVVQRRRARAVRERIGLFARPEFNVVAELRNEEHLRELEATLGRLATPIREHASA